VRVYKYLAFLLVAALLVGIGALVLNAARNTPAVASENWTGYVIHDDRDGVITSLGSWTIPQHDCDSSDIVGAWVGLGGLEYAPGPDAKILEQLGTAITCKNGSAHVIPFYEQYPKGTVSIPKLSFRPGDVVLAKVAVILAGVQFHLENETTQQSFDLLVPRVNVDLTSAECIIEATPPGPREKLTEVDIDFSDCEAQIRGQLLRSIKQLPHNCSITRTSANHVSGVVTPAHCTGGFSAVIFSGVNAPSIPEVPIGMPPGFLPATTTTTVPPGNSPLPTIP